MEARRLNSIKEYYFSTKLKEVSAMNADGMNVLNLGIGNPVDSPPIEVVEQMRTSSLLESAHGYQSYRGASELRNAITQWSKRTYGIDLNTENEVLPLMGSKEGITHICQAFVNPGDEVLVPNPGYPTYRSVASLVGAKVKEYDVLSSVNFDLASLRNQITEKTKIVWLNFPHMPTGEAPNRVVLQELIDLAKERHFLLVNDNPYSTILTDEYFSIFQLKGAKDVCLELNSLSKSFNMAGWRVGWLTGRKELLDIVLKVKSNMDSGMFLPLQQAAALALQLSEKWATDLNVTYKRRRQKIWELLDSLGCSYSRKSSGMFVWASIPSAYNNGESFSEYLLKNARIFVAPGSVFGSNGAQHIRLSLCADDACLEEAIQRINQLKTIPI